MKISKNKFFIVTFLFFSIFVFSQSINYQRTWATYFGDESLTINDTEIDRDGNLYLVGEVNQQEYTDSNFITTPNSYQANYGGGRTDGFIAKISPEGNVIWATFFGGENSDSISSLCIDKSNNIYLLGGTASLNTNITTVGAYQATINGTSDAFIAKFSSSGTKIWTTYYDSFDSPSGIGNGSPGTSIVVDTDNNIYFTVFTSNPNMATPNTFQTVINGIPIYGYNTLLSKFDENGQRIWATYYGVNGSFIRSLDVNTTGLYVVGNNLDCFPTYTSNTYFATLACHQPNPGSCKDTYLSRFSLDGNRLWSTYYGNDSPEFSYSNSSVKCVDSFVYITGSSGKSIGLTTSGSFIENTFGGYSSFLVKFDENGVRLWGTMCSIPIGGIDNPSICNDINGNIYLFGKTNVQGNSTTGVFQENLSGGYDCYIEKFNSNGERQLCTYYGGSNDENSVKILCHNESFYFIGLSKSYNSITTPNSLQPNYASNSYLDINYQRNFFISKFDPNPLTTNEFSTSTITIFPNPSTGFFTIKCNDFSIVKLQLFDINGRKILEQNLQSNETIISTKNIESGVYFIKIYTDDNNVITKKLVVN